MKNIRTITKNHEPNSKAAAWKPTRRVFLKTSGLFIAGLAAGAPLAYANATGRSPKLRFGMVTDPHFADIEAIGTRHYRESVAKMTECAALMNEKKVDFLIELGDLKDQGNPPSEKDTLTYLDTIEQAFKQFKGPRYHVLGNHDMDSLSKQQFLNGIENTNIAKEASFYSFDVKGLHFIVLDANYNADDSDYDHGNFNWADSNVPRQQLDWLRKDLESSSNPVIVFIHQQLDGEGDLTVRNAAEVRQILQESAKVLAVFQGHNHEGHYSHIEGIHYYTLKAMVEGAGEENNSYAIVDVYDEQTIAVTGYRRAASRKMEKSTTQQM